MQMNMVREVFDEVLNLVYLVKIPMKLTLCF